jgi:hypothetical protein
MRIYKELICMRKDQLDLNNAVASISDSNTPNGEAEVMELALDTFRKQLAISGAGQYLFPNGATDRGHQKSFKTTWRATLRRAKVPYFRIYHLRSTYATRLSGGAVADEWVTQLLRQGDTKVFKKYSQTKLQMKREALGQLNRQANKMKDLIVTLAHTGDSAHCRTLPKVSVEAAKLASLPNRRSSASDSQPTPGRSGLQATNRIDDPVERALRIFKVMHSLVVAEILSRSSSA